MKNRGIVVFHIFITSMKTQSYADLVHSNFTEGDRTGCS